MLIVDVLLLIYKLLITAQFQLDYVGTLTSMTCDIEIYVVVFLTPSGDLISISAPSLGILTAEIA